MDLLEPEDIVALARLYLRECEAEFRAGLEQAAALLRNGTAEELGEFILDRNNAFASWLLARPKGKCS